MGRVNLFVIVVCTLTSIRIRKENQMSKMKEYLEDLQELDRILEEFYKLRAIRQERDPMPEDFE